MDADKIFRRALKIGDIDERLAYLEEACGEDSELRTRLEQRLKAHQEAYAIDCLEAAFDDSYMTLDEVAVREEPGACIGRYKLLEKIGEGGMAVVYMAEQERPVQRKVALKIIKLGMDTKQVIARFEAERQALAMMDHPNIARVFDGGTTESGRPYFVMELVRGISITHYCDKHKLNTRQRLSLFVQTCQAVQHAHMKGIIHRDIKPSNIMVTLHDGQPVPKVIDFGIAKATNQRLTEKTLFTRYAQIIGTPAYMSPEQAEMSGLDIDTRTDVYSLGVLLYELLTSLTPIDLDSIHKSDYAKLQKLIQEQEPKKPSTKLAELGSTLTKVAESRQVSAELLRKSLRGDLDWIILKCLEKDRTRRYDSPGDLAEDIKRHLKNKPVLAIPPRLSYQLQKFLWRHKQQVVFSSVLLFASLVVVSVLGLWNHKRIQLQEAEGVHHQAILVQAKASLAKQDWKAALEAIESLKKSPHVGPEARLLYGNVLMQGRNINGAIETFNNLLDEEPRIAGVAHALLARIYWEYDVEDVNKLDIVEWHRNQAETFLTDEPDSYFIRAITTPVIKEKLAFLGEVLEQNPSHFDSRKLRANIHLASRNYDAMMDDALGMIISKPKEASGYMMRGVAQMKQKKWESAMQQFDRALAIMDPNDLQRKILLGHRCKVLISQQNFDQALNEALSAMQEYPKYAQFGYYAFAVYTAQGHYPEAMEVYKTVERSSQPKQRGSFVNWLRKHVLMMLDAQKTWYGKEKPPEEYPFVWMSLADEQYQELSSTGQRIITEGFHVSWSPDGRKFAYCVGFIGNSGIAVYDVKTETSELLIVPGKQPEWSPDGQQIVFVRDCDVLPLSQLTIEGHGYWKRTYSDEEVWVMQTDGTQPRRVARHAGWPSWGKDSNTVYYQCRPEYRLYKHSLQSQDAPPVPICHGAETHTSISPDERFFAYPDRTSNEFRVFKIDAPQEIVACWQKKDFLSYVGQWSPDSQQLFIGGFNGGGAYYTNHGLWMLDVKTEAVSKLLSGQIIEARCSPDQSQMAVILGIPFYDIWLAPTRAVLKSTQTPREHHEKMITDLTRLVLANPNDAYLATKLITQWAYYYSPEEFLKKLDTILSDCKPNQVDRFNVIIAEKIVQLKLPGYSTKAMELADRVISETTSPKFKQRAISIRAWTYYHQQDWGQVVEILTEKVNTSSANGDDHFMLAIAWKHLCEDKKACTHYEKGLASTAEFNKKDRGNWMPYFYREATHLLCIE